MRGKENEESVDPQRIPHSIQHPDVLGKTWQAGISIIS